MDGNFSADHLKQKNPLDDVWLTSGEGMMTEKEAYKTFLAQPNVYPQVSGGAGLARPSLVMVLAFIWAASTMKLLHAALGITTAAS